MQDATSSEDDEDVSHRPAKRKAGQQVFDDDEAAESDGGAGTHARSGRSAVGAGTGATAGPAAKKPRATAEPAAKKPRATADPAAKRPRATIVVDSDSDDAVEAVDEGMSLLLVGRGLQGGLHLSHRMLTSSRIRRRSFGSPPVGSNAP